MTSSIEDVIGRLILMAETLPKMDEAFFGRYAADLKLLLTAYARSQEALEPFAECAVHIPPEAADDITVGRVRYYYNGAVAQLSAADFRRASLAFHGDGGVPGPEAGVPRQDEWRDIASAPRDKNVLVVSQRFPEVHEARQYTQSGWRCYGANGVFNDDPTHWRPLPDPPQPTPSVEGRGS